MQECTYTIHIKTHVGSASPKRLTFKELLEFGLVHVVRDVPHEQLLGVGVPDHPATLGLPLLTFPNWNKQTQNHML